MLQEMVPLLTVVVMAVTGIRVILATVDRLILQASRLKKCAAPVEEADRRLIGLLSSYTEVAKLTEDQKFIIETLQDIFGDICMRNKMLSARLTKNKIARASTLGTCKAYR